MSKIKKIHIFLIVTIILISINMRAPIVAFGPLMHEITNMFNSGALAGFLVTMTLLLYAFGSITALKTNYIYMIFISLISIFFGVLFRSYGTLIIDNIYFTMYFGTFLIGFGMAVCNVLIPVVIKKYFMKDKKMLGLMTGIYVATLCFSAFIGAFISYPLYQVVGIENSLAFWAITTFIAFIFWVPMLKGRRSKRSFFNKNTINFKDSIKSLDTWILMGFLGVQSTIFYSIITWFPLILNESGFSLELSSNINSISQALSILSALIIPKMAANMESKKRKILVLFAVLCYPAGFLFLLFGFKSVLTAIFVAVLFSVPIGGVFGIAVLYISMIAKDVKSSVAISAISQFGGYFLASISPFLIGLLFDFFKTFQSGIITSLVFCLILFLLSLGLTRNK